MADTHHTSWTGSSEKMDYVRVESALSLDATAGALTNSKARLSSALHSRPSKDDFLQHTMYMFNGSIPNLILFNNISHYCLPSDSYKSISKLVTLSPEWGDCLVSAQEQSKIDIGVPDIDKMRAETLTISPFCFIDPLGIKTQNTMEISPRQTNLGAWEHCT